MSDTNTERTVTMYPNAWASMNEERAGEKYQPSNGTEGDIFYDNWCRQCARDRSMSEGQDLDECDDNEVCSIIADTLAHNVTDPEYPPQWQYGKDGQPRCTAFVEAGKPIPPIRCEQTADMFGTES